MELGKVTNPKLDFFTVNLSNLETVDLTRVLEELIREFCNGLIDKKEMWTEGILEPKIKNCGVCLFDGQKIVGIAYFFMSEKYPPPMATVGIVIKPEYQNRGLGRRLLLLLEKIAPNYGITKFRSQIRLENKRSLHIFSRCGYITVLIEKIGDRTNYILEKTLEDKK